MAITPDEIGHTILKIAEIMPNDPHDALEVLAHLAGNMIATIEDDPSTDGGLLEPMLDAIKEMYGKYAAIPAVKQ